MLFVELPEKVVTYCNNIIVNTTKSSPYKLVSLDDRQISEILNKNCFCYSLSRKCLGQSSCWVFVHVCFLMIMLFVELLS